MTTRRDFVGMLVASFLCRTANANRNDLRVACLDWALAETLLALGQTPIATVAASDWSRYVVEPALPSSVADLGLQQEINLELLASLDPHLILTSPFIQNLDTTLPRIAETKKLSIFEKTQTPLEHPRALTLSVARLVHREAQAHRFLDEAELLFDRCRARLARLELPPVLVVSFIDPRHARVYGGSGIFQNVLDRIGVTNAWRRETGYWGFSTVGIEELANEGHLHLAAIGPIPPDLKASLERSPLWFELPFVKAGRISILPPVFMFGAMPAALRFARVMTESIERDYA